MRRLPVFVALLALIVLAPSAAHADAPKATITYRVHICPKGFVHQEFANVCGAKLVANAYIALYSKPTGRFRGQVDSDGAISFEVPAGVYDVDSAPGEFVSDRYLRCIPNEPDRLQVRSVTLNAGDKVVCDYYLVGSSNCDPCPPTPTPLPGAGHVRQFWALVCDHDPGVFDMFHGAMPSGCTMPEGIELTATTGNGKPIGTCITERNGYCALHVLVGAVIVTEDVSTLPDGYAPRSNPQLINLDLPPREMPTVVNVPVTALPTFAPADSSITVHGRVCPAGYAGADYFNDCHDNPPDHLQLMVLAGNLYEGDSLAKTVDAEGDLTFSQLVPEAYTLYLGLPPDTRSTVVQCSPADAPGAVLNIHAVSSPGWSSTAIDLGPHEDLVCDAYTIPPAA